MLKNKRWWSLTEKFIKHKMFVKVLFIEFFTTLTLSSQAYLFMPKKKQIIELPHINSIAKLYHLLMLREPFKGLVTVQKGIRHQGGGIFGCPNEGCISCKAVVFCSSEPKYMKESLTKLTFKVVVKELSKLLIANSKRIQLPSGNFSTKISS